MNSNGVTYTYNAAGELESKGTDTTYSYDRRGQLKGATVPGHTLAYELDALGRRVGRSVDSVLQRRYLYGRGAQPIAELLPNGQVKSQFVYLTGRHAPDLVVTKDQNLNDVVYAVVTDHLGSVRMVVNVETGAVAQRISYDAWGNVTEDTSSGFQPFGFAGGLYDPLTKLVHFGAREYDAVTGRWTRADPILFDGGDANLYAYAGNDPINFADPSGLVIPGSERMVEERRQRIAMWGDLVSTLFSGAGADWRAGNHGMAIGGALSGAALGVLGAFDILMSDPSVQMACMGTSILQTGGRTVAASTARGLNEALGQDLSPREWGRALEALKKAERLPNNYHGQISSTGEYLNPDKGTVIGTLLDFLP